MNFRFSTRTPALIVAGALSALGLMACGDDGDKKTTPTTHPDGGAGDSGVLPTASGSAKPTATGSSSAKPTASGTSKPPVVTTDGGVVVGSDGGTLPVPTGDGGTTVPVASGDIDDLIEAVCGWEFKCCDAGERAYRLGSSQTKITDAATCKAFFVNQLHNNNSADNPFKSGNAAGGLLGALAYQINLDRVTINKDAVNKCIAEQEAMDCAKPAPAKPAACTASGGDDKVDPCSLGALFSPKLKQGDACNFSLTQGGTNDVECGEGTTCLLKTDPANGTDADRCIKRGLQDDFCTKSTDCDFGFACAGGQCVEKSGIEDECVVDTMDAASTCKPGLTCDPQTAKCVQACSLGHVCGGAAQGSDLNCPAGASCAPVVVGDDSFHICRTLGVGAQNRCDDSGDCAEVQYCTAGGVCAPDKQPDDPCTAIEGECASGTYCSSGSVCTAYKQPADACVPSSTPDTAPSPECNPSNTVGCFVRYETDPSNAPAKIDTYHCRATKNVEGEDCDTDFDCAVGKCEVIGDAVSGRTAGRCTAGANLGADCDDVTTDKAKLHCKAGLRCNATTSKCEALLAPGADCANGTDKTVQDDGVCANGTCDETKPWKTFMCTDAPVAVLNGGTGLVCDGG